MAESRRPGFAPGRSYQLAVRRERDTDHLRIEFRSWLGDWWVSVRLQNDAALGEDFHHYLVTTFGRVSDKLLESGLTLEEASAAWQRAVPRLEREARDWLVRHGEHGRQITATEVGQRQRAEIRRFEERLTPPRFTADVMNRMLDAMGIGRSLVDDADAATMRTTLGLGTIATQAANFLAVGASAESKARALLLKCLSPAQRGQLEQHGYFDVTVTKGEGAGEVFRILPSAVFNVKHVATGVYFCAVPEGPVPLSDQMLAQKLVLEANPEEFFRKARRRREEE